MPTKQDWNWLAINSHYQTATAVQQLLQEGNSIAAGNQDSGIGSQPWFCG